jgi:hypothetical protein
MNIENIVTLIIAATGTGSILQYLVSAWLQKRKDDREAAKRESDGEHEALDKLTAEKKEKISLLDQMGELSLKIAGLEVAMKNIEHRLNTYGCLKLNCKDRLKIGNENKTDTDSN